MPIPLTDDTLPTALTGLTARDPRLARIVADYGPPPLWAREPGFPTLLRIILEQQVSLASAKAAFDRLLMVALPLTPERFLELDDATLKAAGFSRQKTRYGRELAAAVLSGSLDLDALDVLDDETVRAELVKVVGIGRWTADIYLLMAGLTVAARHGLEMEHALDIVNSTYVDVNIFHDEHKEKTKCLAQLPVSCWESAARRKRRTCSRPG